MSIQVTIPDGLAQKMWKHAIPFVETDPLSIIEGWVRYFDEHPRVASSGDSPAILNPQTSSDAKIFSPFQPPDLTHTRVRGAFGVIPYSNWNDLLRIAHIEAFKKTGSFDELRTVTHAQVLKGAHSHSGYTFIDEIGISLQGVDSNRAWNYALKLAQYLRRPIHASVDWRQNDKAAFPGGNGTLRWAP